MLMVEYAVQETHHPSKHFHAQYQQKKHQKRYEICSELTIKTSTSEQRRSGVFFVNFDHILLLILLFLLLTLGMHLFTGMVDNGS